jgi:predicted transglutaminase-like cysteine proteinase
MAAKAKRQIFCAAAVLLSLGLIAQAEISEPFGLLTAAVRDGPLWVVWRQLQLQMREEKPIISQCRAEPTSCRLPAALRFIAIVKEGEKFEGRVRIGHINRAANFAIRAINDTTPNGVRRRWTSPLATLAGGVGDCKQYAILKYAALSDAGFALNVRLVILGTKSPQRLQHAVVAVRSEGHWLILDNRSMALVDSHEILDHYIPLFMLDHHGIREFIQRPPQAEAWQAPIVIRKQSMERSRGGLTTKNYAVIDRNDLAVQLAL